ncbi:MAG TPA: hypothetical protein VJP80_00455, partial [Candidatus Saccharimonadales bacterium]|nr:hypothetical protein [Candidatus Saccharimonadales bacterium]
PPRRQGEPRRRPANARAGARIDAPHFESDDRNCILALNGLIQKRQIDSTSMYCKTTIALLCLSLSSCAIFTVDRSNAPGMDFLVGKNFIVAQDSFLIENACIKEYTASNCFLIQVTGGYMQHAIFGVFGAHDEPVQLPISFTAFAADPSKYNRQYVSTSLFGKARQDIVATVPKGSVLTVTRLVSVANGDNGRCWLVFGRLAGHYDKAAIEVPRCGDLVPGSRERPPYWFTLQCPKPTHNFRPGPDNYTLPPVPKPTFLIPLSKSTLTPQPCLGLHSLSKSSGIDLD